MLNQMTTGEDERHIQRSFLTVRNVLVFGNIWNSKDAMLTGRTRKNMTSPAAKMAVINPV